MPAATSISGGAGTGKGPSWRLPASLALRELEGAELAGVFLGGLPTEQWSQEQKAPLTRCSVGGLPWTAPEGQQGSRTTFSKTETPPCLHPGTGRVGRAL